jgi:hypothetical protein
MSHLGEAIQSCYPRFEDLACVVRKGSGREGK